MSEHEVVQHLLDVWKASRLEWHARPGTHAPTALSYCVGVSEALTHLLNAQGIDAETVVYEMTASLTHPDHECGRIVTLSPVNGKALGPGGLDYHVGVETEWGFYDPTFDQFSTSQYDNWSAPLDPVSVPWSDTMLWDESPKKIRDWHGQVHHRWDFVVPTQHGDVQAIAFYREERRYRDSTQALAPFLLRRVS